VASVPHFDGRLPVPYMRLLRANRRNNEAQARIAIDLRIQTYTEPVPLKCEKN